MNFVWKPDKVEADIIALLIFVFLVGPLMADEESLIQAGQNVLFRASSIASFPAGV